MAHPLPQTNGLKAHYMTAQANGLGTTPQNSPRLCPPPPEVVAMDAAAGTVKLKSGAVVPAKISRREHLGGEARVVREERLIEAMAEQTQPRTRTRRRTNEMQICEVCGWGHDAGFSRIEIPGRAPILLHGLMAQIVTLVHAAQASGAGAASTKDERLLEICGGYRHPCKVFDDLKRSPDYKVLFDTKRRGFVRLRINAVARGEGQ